MQRKFSFIEVCIVLLMLGLLAGLILPRVVRNSPKAKIQTLKANVTAAISTARSFSRTQGKDVAILLDSKKNRLMIQLKEAATGTQADFLPSAIQYYQLPTDTTWEKNNGIVEIVTFLGTGGIRGRETIFLVSGKKVVLNVDHLTGRPLWQESIFEKTGISR